MGGVKLYTTGCPKCKVLEKKLEEKGISYEHIYDFDSKELTDKGFYSMPVLEVEGEYLDFKKAIDWVNHF